MSDDIFSEINTSLPEDDLPEGHIKRFENKLNTSSEIRTRLRTFQRYAIAASIAAFVLLSTFVAINMDVFKHRKSTLYNISSELYETELYFTGQIEEKMEILTSTESLDPSILEDIRDIDKTFDEIKTELFRNPYDERLISAVIETYRIKLDLLDEVLLKTTRNEHI